LTVRDGANRSLDAMSFIPVAANERFCRFARREIDPRAGLTSSDMPLDTS
jgi:hypothetical protein